ncbi:MAG: iron-siderophore ABC transporter substrate-binding protein [Cyanobacteria bacterium P01_H01_bin.119]
MLTKLIRNGWMGLIWLILLISCQPTPPGPLSPSLSEADGTGATRVVEHAMGTTVVPASPERVVVLDYAPLDTALALDIQPVGRMAVTSAPLYEDAISAIPTVGNWPQPSLEAILQLDPDLILSNRVTSEAIYSQLAQIAPTVLSQDNGRKGDWQANFQLYAEALGQTERAEQLLADYRQRVEGLQASLTETPETLIVSVIAHWSGGIVAYSANSFSGSVLQEIGFARNPAQGEGKRYGIELSREDLTEIDGDVVFLLHTHTLEDSMAKSAFINDPLWSTLHAVEQGLVCEVDSIVWTGGRSILAANQILTDVELCLKAIGRR